MEIKVIGVVGAGQMGQGIAQTAAQSGFEVLIADQSIESASKGIQKIKAQFDKLIEKQKVTNEQANHVLSLLKPVASLSDLKNCGLIIEAASENINLKKKIWQELDVSVKTDCLFATWVPFWMRTAGR